MIRKSIFVIDWVIMKTYLLIWFSSNGTSPSDVNRRSMSMGFKPIQGAYDYVYDRSNNVDLDEILRFGDKVHLNLHDTGKCSRSKLLMGRMNKQEFPIFFLLHTFKLTGEINKSA
ncbi:hypothetical protein SAMN04488587_0285 [Methanococcoides vulcani]|uniref:Uncharacterized protein n=1 Tax=Methanococcoides vulcani TaxID=1353158 RepID=A0A1H9Y6D1_9EURY|nr:hypothetical protein SAMN04488587_0285 [Methanococcoides vulcani]